jgi:hypothetical protein
MKKIIIIVVSLLVVITVAGYGFRTFTKMASPETSAQFDKNGLKISIFYSQPSKKGRDIFGGLLPYGKVWRTGANEATEIEFSRDVTINGSSLKSGRYSLFTIPNQDKWTVIFNKNLDMWGTQYDQESDVLRVEVPVSERAEVLEKLTISFQEAENGADMSIEWDKAKVVLAIR